MKRVLKAYDYPIFIAVVLLTLFGLVMVYSSSMIIAVAGKYKTLGSDFFFIKQRTALIISFVAMLAAMIIPYKAYKNVKFLMFMMIGISAALAFVTMFGYTSNNATSWVQVGATSVQPAEFAKLALIIYLSAIYGKRQDRINNIDKAVMPPIFFLIFICSLIILQPDYGSAMIIFLISGSIILSSGMTVKSIGKLAVIAAAFALIPAFIMLITGKLTSILSPERISRFTGFMDPFGTAADDGYQLVNSLFAIGSGGISGVGLGDSVQKYGYLPEAHTDFIIAIIAEELGLLGVLFVLLTLGFIVLRGFSLSSRCKDPFGSLLLIGISSMIGIQVFINVGGATGLIPITGITLPFISYGGSSLLMMMISIGIFQNVIMRMNLNAQKEKETTLTKHESM